MYAADLKTYRPIVDLAIDFNLLQKGFHNLSA